MSFLEKLNLLKKTYTGDDLVIARKLVQLEQSAASRGLDFGLKFETVRKLMTQKNCYYTGVELTEKQGEPTQRTIDRLDNAKGYVEGNVVACTQDINLKKGHMTLGEIKAIYSKVKHLL